jgi:hypothetical protein
MVKSLLWWAVSTGCAVCSIFSLLLGIDLCRAAYGLHQPYHFVLTFFASNLIILISLVIFAGVIVRMVARLRQHRPEAPDL